MIWFDLIWLFCELKITIANVHARRQHDTRAAGKSGVSNTQVEIHRKGPAKTPGGILGEKCTSHLIYTIWVSWIW